MGLLLGKLLPYLAIGFSELCLILSFMRFCLSGSHSWQCSTSRVPVSSLSFRIASIGILVSSKANTQSEAINSPS